MDVNTPSDSEIDPLRNDNNEKQEQRDMQDHDVLRDPAQRYDAAIRFFTI